MLQLTILLSVFLSHWQPTDLQANKNVQYRCLPCGRACDKTLQGSSGTCNSCHMELVKANTVYFNNTSPNQICSFLKQHPKTIIIDVRTKGEFEGKADPNFGSLKKAINISIQDLPAKIASIEQYKYSEILVYCSHGHRSEQAAYLLNQSGFKKVTNMLGGMSVVPNSTCKN